MLVFYRVVVKRLVRLGVTVWFGNLSVQLESKLVRLTQTAGRMTGVRWLPSLQSIYQQATLRRANKTVNDASRVPHAEFEVMPSGGGTAHPKK